MSSRYRHEASERDGGSRSVQNLDRGLHGGSSRYKYLPTAKGSILNTKS
jgi:hypothetical protein